MTVEVLCDLRKLLLPDASPDLVTWRTVWRSHVSFGLLLRFDDVKRSKQYPVNVVCIPLQHLFVFYRLTVSDLTFETNATGPFVRLKLRGGKSRMHLGSRKNERIVVPNGTESCLYELTRR